MLRNSGFVYVYTTSSNLDKVLGPRTAAWRACYLLVPSFTALEGCVVLGMCRGLEDRKWLGSFLRDTEVRLLQLFSLPKNLDAMDKPQDLPVAFHRLWVNLLESYT